MRTDKNKYKNFHLIDIRRTATYSKYIFKYIIPILFFLFFLIPFSGSQEEQKPKGFIGYGGGLRWNFETIQEDNDIETDITIINETVLELEVFAKHVLTGSYRWDMAICNISGIESLQYMEEDSQGGFEYSYPEDLNYIKLEYEGLNGSWCEETNNYGFVLFSGGSKQQLPEHFRLIFPEGEKRFKMFTGSGSQVKIGEGAFSPMQTSSCTKIVKDTTEKLHLVWEDSDSDIQYANSTDDGVTWSTKELFAGTGDFYNLIINSTDGLWAIWAETADEDTYYMTSSDYGATWTTAAIIPGLDGNLTHRFDDVSAIMDSNDNVHLCVVTAEWDDVTGNDFLAYTNYTASTGTWSGITWVNEDGADDTDYCDIAVDSEGTVYIAAAGGDGDDMEVWISSEGWGDDAEILIHSSTGDSLPAIYITESDQIYFAWEEGTNDLNFANSTPVNAKAGTFTVVEVDPDTSTQPDIKVTGEGDIFILYSDFVADNSDGFFANSTDNGTTWDARNMLLDGDWSLLPVLSMRGSLIGSDNITDRIDFMYYNDTDSGYYFSYFSVPYPPPLDEIPPTYSLNSTNSTLAGTEVEHSLLWTDDTGLATTGGYIFSFDNCTNSFVNDSWVAFTTNPDWSNVTKTINSTIGCTIKWCVYANDTSNNWNSTSCETPFSYVTTLAVTYHFQNLSESLSLTELSLRPLNSFREEETSLTTLDRLTRLSGFPKTITQSLQIIGFITRLSNSFRTLIDSININDFIERLSNSFRKIIEVININDFIERLSITLRRIIETLNITDFIIKIQGFVKTITQTLNISDFIARLALFYRSVLESFNITDLLAKFKGFATKTITENLNISDFINKLISFFRSFLQLFSISGFISKQEDLYLLDLKDPTESNPESVTVGENITITFNFTKFDSSIIDNVGVLNVSIGGVECTILTS